jgi:hypothetical protein
VEMRGGWEFLFDQKINIHWEFINIL